MIVNILANIKVEKKMKLEENHATQRASGMHSVYHRYRAGAKACAAEDGRAWRGKMKS